MELYLHAFLFYGIVQIGTYYECYLTQNPHEKTYIYCFSNCMQ